MVAELSVRSWRNRRLANQTIYHMVKLKTILPLSPGQRRKVLQKQININGIILWPFTLEVGILRTFPEIADRRSQQDRAS